MNCRKCESPLDPGAFYCGNCGTAIDPAHHPEPAQPLNPQPIQKGDARFNGHATGALVLGIMAIPAATVFFLGIPVAISAMTLGILGRQSAKHSRAVAGIVLSGLALVLTFLIFLPMLANTVAAVRNS